MLYLHLILYASEEFYSVAQIYPLRNKRFETAVIVGRLGKIALNAIQRTNFIHKRGYLRLKTKIYVNVCVCVVCVCVCVCVCLCVCMCVCVCVVCVSVCVYVCVWCVLCVCGGVVCV
jgi:hypothetical protein